MLDIAPQPNLFNSLPTVPKNGRKVYDWTAEEQFADGVETLRDKLALVSPSNLPARRRVVRSYRFSVQAMARKALSGQRLASGKPHRTMTCCRSMRGDMSSVVVARSPETGNAAYRGLTTCGSVWTCPVCASKISITRRDEVRSAIQQHIAAGGMVLSVTLTLRHGISHSARELLDGLAPALKRVRANRRVADLRARLNFVGAIKALEVTYGDRNGWHPHVHELWFIAGKSVTCPEVRDVVGSAWIKAVTSSDLPAPDMKHGCMVKLVTSARDYEGKGVCAIDGIDGTWDAADELTRSVAKEGKYGRLSPFDLLVAGRLALFREYAAAFHGKRQLTWSPRLKDTFGIEDRSDEDVCVDHPREGEPVLELPAAEWKHLLKHKRCDLRPIVLEHVERFGAVSAIGFLRQFGIFARLPVPPDDYPCVCADNL